MYCAIDGGSRGRQDARNMKRLIGMVDEADVAGAVGEDDFIAQFVA